MSSDSIRTHKRKNSHLYNEQNTSGASVRSDYDISVDNMELENLAQPSISRINSIPTVPTVPLVASSQEDLENQDQFLETSWNSFPSSMDNWYLNKKFGQNKKRVACIIAALIIGSFTLFFLPLLFDFPSKNSSNNNNNINDNNEKPNPKSNNQNRVKPDKSFTIDNVFNGDFHIDKKTFHFIDPPYLFESHDMDPGLYFTTENSNGETKFKAKQLFDDSYEKDLGTNKFTHEGHEYLVESIKPNYALDKLLFGTDIIEEFRHSSTACYWIKDVEANSIRPVTPYFDSEEPVRLSYVKFSPSYNFIYFVFKNNLYFQDIRGEHAPVPVSSDGNPNILNGKTDWVYEEEVIPDDKAVWWAPDDSKFVFARFNDTEVDEYQFPRFTTNQQYNPITSIKYPKPGSMNPTVDLFFYSIGDNVIYSVNMDHPTLDEIILYDANWVGPDNFMFKQTDRYSKELSVKMFDTKKGEILNMRSYNAKSFNGWFEKTKKITVIPPNESSNRKEYGYVDIHQDNEGFNHLFYYPTPQSKEGIQLTNGKWEIIGRGVVGFEHEADVIYFTSNYNDPMSQNLFGVKLNRPGELILLQDPDQKYSFYDFDISSSGRYAVMNYLGPSLPVSAVSTLTNVLSVEDAKKNGALILSNEEKIVQIEDKYNLPVTSYKSMILDDGTEVNYIEIKPKNMDPNRKHPLLVNVYGGPGSQTFTAKSAILLEQSVSSGLEAIVLQIEPRGTGGKGWKFRSWATNNLGYWEPRDVTEVTKRVISDNEAHIDKDRVAIWGWSYGGFTTLKTVEYDKGKTFKFAVAVAPVTSWLYYDSIYTERYMDSVQENLKTYIDTSRINDIGSFKELSRLMLIHGTSDDNVHIQNTYELVDKLNVGGVRNYDMYIFPDSDHSIRFHNSQSIVYKKIYCWLQEAYLGNLDNISH